MSLKASDEKLEREVLSFLFNSDIGFNKAIEYNIKTSDFVTVDYKKLYKFLAKYYAKNHYVADKITILEEMGFSDDDKRIQFEAELDRLMRKADVPPPRLDKQLSKLRNYTIIRKWLQLNEETIEKLNKDEITGIQIAEKFNQELSNLLLQSSMTDAMNLGEGFDRFLKAIAQKKSGEIIVSYKTGYTEIDEHNLLTSGLTYILGRPGSGKTLVADNLTFNMATIFGTPVVLMSAEMNNDEHMERMISKHTQIEYKKIIMGHLNDEEIEIVKKAKEELKEKPLYFLFNADFGVKELISYIKWYHEVLGVNVFFIDYFQLLKGFEDENAKWKKDAQTRFSEISTAMRILSAQLGLTIIMLAQASKKVDDRNDKKIQLSDMRWTDQAVQDAINVLALYNDEQYNGENAENKGFIEIDVLKARKAQVGKSYKLRYDSTTQCLMNPVGVDNYDKEDLDEVGIVVADEEGNEEVIDFT